MKRLLLLAVTVSSICLATQARAGVAIGADLTLGVPLGGGVSDMLNLGYGFDARVGYQLSLVVLKIQPEVVFSYMGFGDDNDGSSVYRGMVGGRAALGLGLMPFVYAHIGYGNFSTGLSALGGSALTYDVGGGIDFSLLPLLSLGISGGYNVIQTDEPMSWFSLGAHAQLSF